MTDKKINHAIAQACGIAKAYKHIVLYRTDADGWTYNCSDYCNDLNAMHEAERHIPDDLWEWYISNLALVTKAEDSVQREFLCATARQRAEAFLRTLGKWEEVQP